MMIRPHSMAAVALAGGLLASLAALQERAALFIGQQSKATGHPPPVRQAVAEPYRGAPVDQMVLGDWGTATPPLRWKWFDPPPPTYYEPLNSSARRFGQRVEPRAWTRLVQWNPQALDESERVSLERSDGRISLMREDQAFSRQTAEMLADVLVLDLGGTGPRAGDRTLQLSPYGSPMREQRRWFPDGADGYGILVFDADGDGVSGTSELETFGIKADFNGDGLPDWHRDGYEALLRFVQKSVEYGVLEPRVLVTLRLEERDLAALERAGGFKVKVGGLRSQAVSLKSVGVTSLALSEARRKTLGDFDGRGNQVTVQEGALFLRADETVGHYVALSLFELPAKKMERPQFHLASPGTTFHQNY